MTKKTTKPYFSQKRANTWKRLSELYNDLGFANKKNAAWIFRGQESQIRRNSPYFQTHLEKAFDNYGIALKKKRICEKVMVREFQRKASLYLKKLPDKNDLLEWLSIMRHCGAPTRLMDWTYSFWVAVYFAVAGLDFKKSDRVTEKKEVEIWCFNSSICRSSSDMLDKYKTARNTIKTIKTKKTFDRLFKATISETDPLMLNFSQLVDNVIVSYFFENPKTLVYAVNSYRLHSRITAQRGVFLMPGDIQKSFDENLKATLNNSRKDLIQIILHINREERNVILQHLKRTNITNVTLFKTLDGFSRSIGEQLSDPGSLGIKALEENNKLLKTIQDL